MNKQEYLKEYKKQEDKICIAQILDKIENSQKENKITYTDFLDMYQISLVSNFLKKISFKEYILVGGYKEAERKCLIIYPSKEEENAKKLEKEILKIVRINLYDEDIGKYTHRNYLGGIVKLGLKREKVGDILVRKEGADIICLESFAEILKQELSTLTRFEKSKIEIKEMNEIIVPIVQKEEIKIIIPSFRLDNFVSDLARTSRSKAVEIIKQERVFINGQNETKVSKQVKEGDIITIRGKGRFVVKQLSGTTRSGRTVVIIEKYV